MTSTTRPDVRGWLAAIETSLDQGTPLQAHEAVALLQLAGQDAYELLGTANRVARARKGVDVELCGIVNAKSGRCRENCAFCAQSAHYRTLAPQHELISADQMVEASRGAKALHAARFGIVTSGTRIRAGAELDAVCRAVQRIAHLGETAPCASLGILDDAALSRLRDAGLTSYHHNLETSRSFFPEVCTTHDYDDDVETVRATHRLGLRACSGGIFGLGESASQRVELAATLRDLRVESVPINFLVPIEGTPLAARPALEPLECLKIVAMFRLMMPHATIKVCAGRARNLGDLVSWIFFAGADGMMVGDFLTTPGRGAAADLDMIEALGFRPIGPWALGR
jgi:biotin synthase